MADEKNLQDEIMSDEDLDGVAGGNYSETRLDKQMLSQWGLLRSQFADNNSLIKAFAKKGIKLTINDDNTTKNIYERNGKTISREEALNWVRSKC